MTLHELRKKLKEQALGQAPDHEVDGLFSEVLSLSRGHLELQRERILQPLEIERIQAHFDRLRQGEPLAYILGHQDFYKSRFLVTPGVLIPRPETELLVELALEKISQDDNSLIADLGAGSGCIGLSLAAERPKSQIFLFEASPKARLVCEQNRVQHHLKNAIVEERLIDEPDQGPWPWARPLDIVVANPPYISEDDTRVARRVHQFEPHQALYAPRKGLHWIHKWMKWSYHHLKDGGWFCFEFGKDQESEILDLVDPRHFLQPILSQDYSGANRFMSLQKRSSKDG